jgi:multidrug efflux pump subunit AcrA (membrane-fusion protein)
MSVSMFMRSFAILSISIALVGCGLVNPPEPTPIPTSTPAESDRAFRGGGVVASGEVVPVRDVQLSFDRNGRVLMVEVEQDEQVESGQVIAQLEGQETLEAGVTAAALELLAAQQDLDLLYEDNDKAKADAFQEIVEANQVIGETKFRLDYLNLPVAFQGMDTSEALILARENYDRARENFEPYKYRPSGDSTRKDFLDALERARSEFNSVMRLLELEADLNEAQVNLDSAEQEYEILVEGPDPDEIALAQARIDNAEASLDVARKALEGATLIAPISGTAVSVDILPGEAVLAGQTVMTLADLGRLRVETTDLSERDVARISVGQDAMVYIEALDVEASGVVARISPQANVVGGDVVYTVLVELDGQPEGLRWGMTVEVTIETE